MLLNIHNAFINNSWQDLDVEYTSQAFDWGQNNNWYNDISLEGNYWSDWSGIGVYELDSYSGETSNSDPYPLNSSPL